MRHLNGVAAALLLACGGCFGADGCCSRPGSDAAGPGTDATPGTDAFEPVEGLCGDSLIDPGESCDGPNLNGTNCAGIGFAGGTLACTPACAFDPTACHNCGNAQTDPGEECDGSLPAGMDCAGLGYTAGALACGAECLVDTSGCTLCGNAVAETGEACEGAPGPGVTCVSLGYASGTLSCAADCVLDDSACVPFGAHSLEFDGVDDVLDCGLAAVPIGTPYTIEVWFYWDGDDGVLLGKWGELFVDGLTFMLYIETDATFGGTPTLMLEVAGGSGGSGVGVSIPGAGWHHAAFGSAAILIDGVVQPGGSTAPGTLAASSAPLLIGGPASPAPGDSYYSGRIDEVRIWSVARTSADVVAGMYTELAGTEPGLTFYASFEDGPGDTTAVLGTAATICTLGSAAGPDSADPTWSPDVPF